MFRISSHTQKAEKSMLIHSFIQMPILRLSGPERVWGDSVCLSVVLLSTVMQPKPVYLVTISTNNHTCQKLSQGFPVTFTDTLWLNKYQRLYWQKATHAWWHKSICLAWAFQLWREFTKNDLCTDNHCYCDLLCWG